jgi:hypothetical protein
MLLLGSFESKPVHNSDIIEAQSFLIFFRRSLRSRNLPTEQLRNRPVEKKKYQLPTTASGVIIDNKVQLLLEAKRKSNACAPIQYHHKGGNLPKKMFFF